VINGRSIALFGALATRWARKLLFLLKLLILNDIVKDELIIEHIFWNFSIHNFIDWGDFS